MVLLANLLQDVLFLRTWAPRSPWTSLADVVFRLGLLEQLHMPLQARADLILLRLSCFLPVHVITRDRILLYYRNGMYECGLDPKVEVLVGFEAGWYILLQRPPVPFFSG